MSDVRKMPTKAQWEYARGALSHSFGRLAMRVDQFKVDFEVRMVKHLKYEIMPFVDGHHRGAWMLNDCKERRRFLRPVKLSLYTPAERAKLQKAFGKRGVQKYFPRLNEKRTVYYPTWSSFEALRRHLVANNRDIEILYDKHEGAA